jgi:hypothetical protein
MAKAANSDPKAPIRAAPRPQPVARAIKSFESAPGPKVEAMSQGAPKRFDALKPSASRTGADVVEAAENPPGIDGRQMRD